MTIGDLSIQGARLGINLPLTNLAQAYVQAEYVMKLLFPLAEVGTYGGQIIQFDDSVYDDVDDARADDAPYPDVATRLFERERALLKEDVWEFDRPTRRRNRSTVFSPRDIYDLGNLYDSQELRFLR